jgi:3-carboxy-cis,cis-muconate cycloisomerase
LLIAHVMHNLFDDFLSTDEMNAVFDAARLVQGMLDFERALAQAQSELGLIPREAVAPIAQACDAALYDLPALLSAARRAGSLAIPLVKALTAQTALINEDAARHVHKGSTSQDVIDTANVLMTREALALIQTDLRQLQATLKGLAHRHAATPILARTLMQPATVTTLGFKISNWTAALARSEQALQALGEQALALQLGGAVGTLSAMGDAGPAVVRRMAELLQVRAPQGCWHTQRDDWVRLGAEVGILTGSLGKIAQDLSLMAQGEIGELAEPSGAGRGGSSAMPHKRNPVSAMLALAASYRAPAHVGALLACMPQEHERGLGNWQAELAEWPGLFTGAHSALKALNDAFEGLQVNTVRMRENIESLQGLIFAEAAGQVLAQAVGRSTAHHVMETLSQRAVALGEHLMHLTLVHVNSNEALRNAVDDAALRRAFDPDEAARHAAGLTLQRLADLDRH